MRVTTSIGAATAARTGTDVRALVEAADQALYRAKRGGKNRTERANGERGEGEGKSGPTAKIRGDG
jgi:predicted signal transduction protein with EAL and GGDEF domain